MASFLKRGTRKVRFSIDGEKDELADAESGVISPIAVDDDEIVCVGEDVDKEKQDAKQEERQLAALEAVEGQLGSLKYGKTSSKRNITAPDVTAEECTPLDSTNKRRRASNLKTPPVNSCVPASSSGRACIRIYILFLLSFVFLVVHLHTHTHTCMVCIMISCLQAIWMRDDERLLADGRDHVAGEHNRKGLEIHARRQCLKERNLSERCRHSQVIAQLRHRREGREA